MTWLTSATSRGLAIDHGLFFTCRHGDSVESIRLARCLISEPKPDRVFSDRKRFDHHVDSIGDGPVHRIRRSRTCAVLVASAVLTDQEVIERRHSAIEHRALYPIGGITCRWIRRVTAWQALNLHTIDDDPASAKIYIDGVPCKRAEFKLRVGEWVRAAFIVPSLASEQQEQGGPNRDSAVAPFGREAMPLRSAVYKPDLAGLSRAAVRRIKERVEKR